MPQKRNPDCMELIRGKSGTILGNVCSLSLKNDKKKNILKSVIIPSVTFSALAL